MSLFRLSIVSLFYRFICKLNRRPSSLSLDTLPDDVLLLLLDYLSLLDLLRLRGVCLRLYHLVPSATRRRRTLILDDGTWSIENTQSMSTFSSAANLRNVDGSPVEQPMGNLERYALRLSLKEGVLVLCDGFPPFQQLIPQLPALLPTVYHLAVSMKQSSHTLALLVPLLQAWAPSLTSFYLLFWAKDDPLTESHPLEEYQKEIETIVISLFESLNELPRLRHLNFWVSIDKPFKGLPSPTTVRLPIIRQLESFLFYSWNIFSKMEINLPLEELIRYYDQPKQELSNSSLKLVSTLNYLSMASFAQVSDQLASLFTCLSLVDNIISRANRQTLSRLCDRFSSLVDLRLRMAISMPRLVEILQPLVRLKHLEVQYLARKAHTSHRRPPPLSSVQSLVIRHYLRRHDNLRAFRLGPALFPALQVGAIQVAAEQCLDCQYDRGKNPLFNPQLAAACDEQSRQALAAFPKLRIIVKQERVDWHKWETARPHARPDHWQVPLEEARH